MQKADISCASITVTSGYTNTHTRTQNAVWLTDLSLCFRTLEGAFHGGAAERSAEVHAGQLPAPLPCQQARYWSVTGCCSVGIEPDSWVGRMSVELVSVSALEKCATQTLKMSFLEKKFLWCKTFCFLFCVFNNKKQNNLHLLCGSDAAKHFEIPPKCIWQILNAKLDKFVSDWKLFD